MDQIKRKRKWRAEIQLDKLISIKLHNHVIKEKTLTISFYDSDAGEAIKVLWNWFSDIYNFGTDGTITNKTFTKEDYKSLSLICEDKEPLEQLQFDFMKHDFKVYPKSINFGDLDFSSSESVMIGIEFFIFEE